MTQTLPSSSQASLVKDTAQPSPPSRDSGERDLRRKASEQELSAAEALSALAGTGIRQPDAENHVPPPAVPEREDLVSPKTTPAVVAPEETPKKRKKATGKTEGDKPAAAPARKRKASATGDGVAESPAGNGKPRKRAVKDKGDGDPPLAPEPTPTAYNPKRISAPVSILQPITQDELAYIRNPRNIRNPLKTGRPTKFASENDASSYTRDPYSASNGARQPSEAGNSAPGEQVIERGGDPRGGKPSREDMDYGSDRAVAGAKRGRDDVPLGDAMQTPAEDDRAKRPRVGGEIGKGYQVAEHCTSLPPSLGSRAHLRPLQTTNEATRASTTARIPKSSVFARAIIG